jgi:hypothetical protein
VVSEPLPVEAGEPVVTTVVDDEFQLEQGA